MIKFALRRNLIYPLQLLIWNALRDTECILISYYFSLDSLLIYTPLMFLGELFGGLIFYLYQNHYLSKNENKMRKYFLGIKYNKVKPNSVKDKSTKIYFLIFCATFYDFIQFLFSLIIPKFSYISYSIEQRLRGSFTIYNALFYYYILRLPLFKHHFFSLAVIGICIILVVITEIIFQDINIFLPYGKFILAIIFTLLIQLFSAWEESIEKYLYEYAQLNPFIVLLFEGVFGFILTFILNIFYNPFNEIIQFKNNKSNTEFIILIIALILYIILSAGKNIFRMITTKIYTPMTSTFMDYILNPFYIILYFCKGDDFISNGKSNIGFFIINLIISIITTLCGGVYNEFLILFCCGLERNTHNQIKIRAFTEGSIDLSFIPVEEEVEEEEEKKNDFEEK